MYFLEIDSLPSENIQVTAELSNDNHLAIEITFGSSNNHCLERLDAVQFNLSDVNPPIQQILQCGYNTHGNGSSSSQNVCSGRFKIATIDKCKTHRFALRPLYGNISLFNVPWIYMDLNALLSEVDRSEKERAPQVKLIEADNNQQMVTVYWDGPVCLLEDPFSWEVRISSTVHSIGYHSIRLSSECSSGSHTLANVNATSFFRHSLQLDNGHLSSSCNASNSSASDSHETDFIFLPCSSYLVNVIPVDVELIGAETYYSQSVVFNTSLSISRQLILMTKYAFSEINSLYWFPTDEMNPKVTNVTSKSFGLEWSFPVSCSQQVQMDKMFVEINGAMTDME